MCKGSIDSDGRRHKIGGMDNTEMVRSADEALRGLPSDFRLTPDQSETFAKVLTMTGPLLKKVKLVWLAVDPEDVERFRSPTTGWFRRYCILARMVQVRPHKVYRFLRYGYGSPTVKCRILNVCNEHGVALESLALRPGEPTPKKWPGLPREASPAIDGAGL